MTSLAIDRFTMQLTSQNRFTQSFSGGYIMTNGSRLRTVIPLRMEGKAIKESAFRSHHVHKEVDDGE